MFDRSVEKTEVSGKFLFYFSSASLVFCVNSSHEQTIKFKLYCAIVMVLRINIFYMMLGYTEDPYCFSMTLGLVAEIKEIKEKSHKDDDLLLIVVAGNRHYIAPHLEDLFKLIKYS